MAAEQSAQIATACLSCIVLSLNALMTVRGFISIGLKWASFAAASLYRQVQNADHEAIGARSKYLHRSPSFI
jgi:hypothetical protein